MNFVASPRARRLMRERGIDRRDVRGSGPGGRIVAADVPQFASAAALSPMRRAIVQATTASAAVPQFTLRAELDASALLAFRARLLEQMPPASEWQVSITDLLLCAQARALRACPAANRVWRDGAIQPLPTVAVGLVVSLDDGLLIPCIRDADQLELQELARQRAGLVQAARAGRLGGESLAGAASSLSNLGPSRVDDFAAILYPPQSSILAAGRVAPRPFVVDGQLCARPTLRLNLTADHRVLDGAPAADFLGHIIKHLESPAPPR
jgi:pyruvate dehydrogenase E2 component (dihydrolipoamide acetyltransferase)